LTAGHLRSESNAWSKEQTRTSFFLFISWVETDHPVCLDRTAPPYQPLPQTLAFANPNYDRYDTKNTYFHDVVLGRGVFVLFYAGTDAYFYWFSSLRPTTSVWERDWSHGKEMRGKGKLDFATWVDFLHLYGHDTNTGLAMPWRRWERVG
jgi:hypothetical protein